MRIQLIINRLRQVGRPPGEDIADSGAVVVLVGALMSVVFIAVAAFTIDFGNAWSTGRVLSTAADGASQAAARQLHVSLTAGQTCAALVGSAGTAAQAEGEAVAADVMGSAWTEISIECVGPGHALVTATVAARSTGSFGGWHRDNYPLSRTAATIVAPAGSVRGVMGLGICYGDADNLVNAATSGQQGSLITVIVSKSSTQSCAVGDGSGNWSILDFDASDSGCPSYEMLLSPDHSQEFPVTTHNIPACPGADVANNLHHLNAVLGEHLLFPVYDNLSGTGNNTTYQIRGFVPAQLCGWRRSSNSGYDQPGCHDGVALEWASGGGNNRLVALKLRPSRLIPVSDIHTTCGLGGTECQYAPIVVRPVA